MNPVAYEGVVEKGSVRLPADVQLPDNTKVYILIPDPRPGTVAHIYSPRLANPEDAKYFEKTMEVLEERGDADV